MFHTHNYADNYSPEILKLHTSEPPVAGYLQNVVMPRLQKMHQRTAASPRSTAKLFLLMEKLVIGELLCIASAYIGSHQMVVNEFRPACIAAWEDDLASSGEPGLANFAAAMQEPLESQARGFAHGHKKVIAVPRARAAHMRSIFTKRDGDLAAFMAHLRESVLKAASTIQYDAACLPAQQLGQAVPPEPFSRMQQVRSRLDGGTDIDGTVRALLQLTEDERQGHIQKEAVSAAGELRPPRHAYKELPLTGAHQSVLPTYRLPQAFGQITLPDERGLFDLTPRAAAERVQPEHLPWQANELGEVLQLKLPDGRPATEADMVADAELWEQAFARHVRATAWKNLTPPSAWW